MASTVKVAVAALYMAQVDHGRRNLDDTINGAPAGSLMARMLIHSDNRATDILSRTSAARPRFTPGFSRTGSPGFASTARRATAERQAGPVGPPRFEHSDGHGRSAEAALQGGADQAREPQLRARLMAQCQTGRNRMKALLPGRSGRTQDRDAERPRRRRRLPHHARRPPGRGRDLHARRRRSPAHHRRSRQGDLRRIQVHLRLAVRRSRLSAQ